LTTRWRWRRLDLGACLVVANGFDQGQIEYRQQFFIDPTFPFHFVVGECPIDIVVNGFYPIFKSCV
jgi:hypothetical protein